jgi:hypothetical protein
LIYNQGKEIPVFPTELECLIRKRIGELRNQYNTWYDIDEKTDENVLIVEMQANLTKYILPYLKRTNTKEDCLSLIDREKRILSPLGKLIVYAELKQLYKAKTEYLTILKEKSNSDFLETVRAYGKKHGLA